MKREIFTSFYDEYLQIEAYQLEGSVLSFPNHFHEHYTIGYIEQGECLVSCKNQDHTFSSGDLILMNPKDNHTFISKGDEKVIYRGFIIRPEVMEELMLKVSGQRYLPVFTQTVVRDGASNYDLNNLFMMVSNDFCEIEKEESLFFMVTTLLSQFSQAVEGSESKCQQEVERASEFIDVHFRNHISLEQICQHVTLSKSTLMRAFTKYKGITPYRYLINVRINTAKKLLEEGVMPVDAAFQTGFSDQSHFTRFFTTFIGISPGAYRDLVISRSKL